MVLTILNSSLMLENATFIPMPGQIIGLAWFKIVPCILLCVMSPFWFLILNAKSHKI